MDNSMFRSLTCGVKFNKKNLKRNPPIAKTKVEEIKIESDGEEQSREAPVTKRKKLSEAYLHSKNLEDTNKIRKQHQINVKGPVSVKPIESFAELFKRYPLHPKVVENITNFKYENPTPVQMQVLPLMLEKKAVKVTAKTGSGMSLRFR